MTPVDLAWIILASITGIIFLATLHRTGSIRRALIAALLAGKLMATALSVGGLDKPLAKLTIGTRTGPIASFSITAGQALVLLFAGSLAIVAASRSDILD